MINAKELRVGNLLKVGKVFWELESLISNNDDTYELYFKENPEYDHFYNAEPIILTEEWLIKFGFTKIGYWYTINHIFMPTSININLQLLKLTIGSNEEYHIDGFQFFVHNLQNLYFSLTMVELKTQKIHNNKKIQVAVITAYKREFDLYVKEQNNESENYHLISTKEDIMGRYFNRIIELPGSIYIDNSIKEACTLRLRN